LLCKSPTRYHHGNLREELVHAAVAAVDLDGAQALSISALAKALGVSQPAAYRHFVDKDDLLASVATEGFTAFHEALQAALDRRTKIPPLGKLAQGYVGFARGRPNMYRLMFDTPIVADAEDGSALSVAADGCFALLLSTLGGPSPDDTTKRAALSAWTGLHGIMMLEQTRLLPDLTLGIKTDDIVRDLVIATMSALGRGSVCPGGAE
jgi:AcrR family transcriptional regulator